jgi:hypothetical protein
MLLAEEKHQFLSLVKAPPPRVTEGRLILGKSSAYRICFDHLHFAACPVCVDAAAKSLSVMMTTLTCHDCQRVLDEAAAAVEFHLRR